MPYKVLVVDDSQFFQRRLTELINSHDLLNVIGVASNGLEAIEKAEELKPDLITMDYEMPVLNGVSAVQRIMNTRPVPILMFSSMTYEGARITLEALEAGAVDFVPKDFAEVSGSSYELKQKLHTKILDILRTQKQPNKSNTLDAATCQNKTQQLEKKTLKSGRQLSDRQLKNKTEIVVIGASTGGPVALTELLTALPNTFSLPLVLVQHMPANFTRAFAERLNKLCSIQIREAEDGDELQSGLALLAPGGKQLMLDPKNRGRIKILPGDFRIPHRPSLDITFGSAAKSYKDSVLGIVLTGMGTDGCDGAGLLKQSGSTIWTQDENSSVIYGMPKAVASANLSDREMPLKEIGSTLAKLFK